MQGPLIREREAAQRAQLLTEREAAQQAQVQGELDGLIRQRGELQSQLGALSERRNQLFAQSITATTPAAKAELDARIAEIDGRSARLDRQIQTLNERITETMGRLNSPGERIVNIPRIVQGQRIEIPSIQIPPIRRGPDIRQIGGFMIAEAMVLALIGVLFWRMGVKRLHAQFERMVSSQSQQLAQLQHAVDTVAIEVERISEAQRYVAKVLTEGETPALSSPPAEPRRK